MKPIWGRLFGILVSAVMEYQFNYALDLTKIFYWIWEPLPSGSFLSHRHFPGPESQEADTVIFNIVQVQALSIRRRSSSLSAVRLSRARKTASLFSSALLNRYFMHSPTLPQTRYLKIFGL